MNGLDRIVIVTVVYTTFTNPSFRDDNGGI